MNFDTVVLAAVTDELNKKILGARIDKISQPEPLELIVGLYKDSSHINLLINAEPDIARVHLTSHRRRSNPLSAPSFCMLLRKYIEGAVIDEIAQPYGFGERVLAIRIRRGPTDPYYLIIEVMGRQSNIILTAKNGMILGAVKRVTPAMSRLREIRAGIAYTPPPKQLGYKRDPMEPISAVGLPTEAFSEKTEAEKWLTATFRGVGPLIAKEAVLRCPDAPLTGENIWFGLNDVLSQIRVREWAPIIYRDQAGRVLGAYPIALRSVTSEQQSHASTISDALDSAYNTHIEDDALTKERLAFLAALRRAHKSAERQLLDVREGLFNAEASDYIRESGELLLSNINAIESGASEALVTDFFSKEPGCVRSIRLDPQLSVQENAQKYFRRFQKARDSKETLLARQSTLQALLIETSQAMVDAERATNLQQIASLTAQLGKDLPFAQTSGGEKPPESSPFEGHKIKTYRSPDGWEILVGENSTSNDYLTTKVASSSDIWLHARAVPSAHAIIRSQNRPGSVSTAALMLAAEQVAKRSGAKHARLVSIDYTLKKYVRKPRGAAPGQVTYTNEKTLDVIAQSE